MYSQVSSIVAELESLHCEGSDGVCIEVRGHQLAEERSSGRGGREQTSESAKSPSSSSSSSSLITTSPSLLIEQWNFNTVTKRYCVHPVTSHHVQCTYMWNYMYNTSDIHVFCICWNMLLRKLAIDLIVKTSKLLPLFNFVHRKCCQNDLWLITLIYNLYCCAFVIV